MANIQKYIGPNSLKGFLDQLKTIFANKSHKHSMADIEDYVVDTELSSESNNPIANSAINAELDAMNETMENALSSIEIPVFGVSGTTLIITNAIKLAEGDEF